MNFCRLPPDRLDAAASSPLHLTLKRSITSRENARIRGVRNKPEAHHALPRAGQQRVVREAHRRDRAAAEAFFRHEAQAESTPLRRPERARRRAAEADGVGVADRRLAGQRGEQFLLAVARHAGDAEDLAAADLDADVVERRAERIGGRERQAADLEARLAGLLRREAAFGQVAADHHAARGSRWSRATASAVPLTRPPRSTVAMSHSARISSSLWLM